MKQRGSYARISVFLLLLCFAYTGSSSIRKECNEASFFNKDIESIVEKADYSAGIWITLSQRGLNWLKDMLLTQVMDSIIPLRLPDVTKTANIPFAGQFSTCFTNVTLTEVSVPSSTIALGQTGILVQASDVSSNLTLQWQYDYDNIWLPNPVSDSGGADVQVAGMQAGLTLTLKQCNGTLHLDIQQSGIYIRNLEVQLNGYDSWLYQWLMSSLEDRIRVTTQEQLNAAVQEGVVNLNSFLLDIPREVPVDDLSKLNFTIVSEPIISPSSLSIGVQGEFVARKAFDPPPRLYSYLPSGLLCTGDMKMITIALSESVFNDGAMIYYNADLLNWLAEKVPDYLFLNTSKWKYLIPQLYHKYPNEEIKFHFEVSTVPVISITKDGFIGLADAQMIIEVVDNGEVVPVACISINASLSGSAGINGNNITGQINLEDLNLDLKWSNVGRVHLASVKVLLRSLLKDIILPVLNMSLRRGFPLPVISSMELKDANVEYGDGYLLVCTDVQYIMSPTIDDTRRMIVL